MNVNSFENWYIHVSVLCMAAQGISEYITKSVTLFLSPSFFLSLFLSFDFSIFINTCLSYLAIKTAAHTLLIIL